GPDAPMKKCVILLAERRGTVVIVDGEKRVSGVVTAGDLTRLMEKRDDFLSAKVREIMTKAPKLVQADELAGAALYRMEQHGIMAMPVVDKGGALLGLVHLHDLMKAGAA
ncbi:MAG: CBS domain-containing protein, partial [Gemmatimonadales bacterium]